MTGFVARKLITRPADTTAYGANDVVGGVCDFGPVAPPGSVLLIRSTALLVRSTGLIASEANYTMHFYSASPPSALADNAPWDLPDVDRSYYYGSLLLGTPVDLGTNLWIETNTWAKAIAIQGSNLYGYLTTAGAYTPTASRVVEPVIIGEIL